jgi:nuclear pore complex protein Nup214
MGNNQLFTFSNDLFFQNVQKVREFVVSSDNADAIQLCWNPVMNMTLALITNNGTLNTYTLKDTGVEFHSTDPNYKAKCCCWSPKGKQIVAGFVNGKLAQFTPELKPAKIIDWQPGTFTGNFDTIAIQWLSTFQFAVAFLDHQPESRPGKKRILFNHLRLDSQL